jgi:hypothetical protein
MVTTEYVVGTLAAASVAGVLVAAGTDGWLLDLVWDLIRNAFRPGVLLEQVHHIPWYGWR